MADLTKGIKNIVLGGIGAAAITAEKAGEVAKVQSRIVAMSFCEPRSW